MMRFWTAAVLSALLLPTAAFAQASRLQQELTAAERQRDALIAEADTAIAAKDWKMACEKGTAAAAKAELIVNLADQYFDALDSEEFLDESDYDAMDAELDQLIAEWSMIDNAREAVCETAAE